MSCGRRAVVLLAALMAVGWAGVVSSGDPQQETGRGFADRSAEELLRLAVEREAGLRYQAVRRAAGGWSRRGEEVRLYQDGRERYRLDVLGPEGDPSRIFIRVGGQAWVWSAREPEVWRERGARSSSGGPWRHLDLVLANYGAEVAGREALLGRPCAVLRIASARPNRPQVRLWVDLEHCLGLKMERTSPSGQSTLDYEFTELSFPEQFDGQLFTVPEGQPSPPTEARQEGPAGSPETRGPRRGRPRMHRFGSLSELVGAVDMPVLVPGVVPAGFVQMEYGLLTPMEAVRIGYTDGLSEISLYQRGPRPEGQTRLSEPEAGGEGEEAGRSRRGRSPAGGAPPASRGEGTPAHREPHFPGVREEDSQTVVWKGVELQVGRMRGMIVVRRPVTVGEATVRTTIMGEIGEEELKDMSASLVECQVPAASSEASGGQSEGGGR